jgi:hypothetical protein
MSINSRKREELEDMKVLGETKIRLESIKNLDRKKFRNVDLIILYLVEIRDKYLKERKNVIGHLEGGYSKKELYENARKEYFENLTNKEKEEFLKFEANRIKQEYTDLEYE